MAAQPDTDTNATLTVTVGAVGVLLLLVIVLALEALFHAVEHKEFERKVVLAQPVELRSLQARQLELLHRYRWVDPSRRVAAIPIERAMELVVREAASRPEPAAPQDR